MEALLGYVIPSGMTPILLHKMAIVCNLMLLAVLMYNNVDILYFLSKVTIYLLRYSITFVAIISSDQIMIFVK